MDFSVFSPEQQMVIRTESGSEQAAMERTYRLLCDGAAGESPVCEMLHAAFCGCDAAKRTLALRFTVEDWMQNDKMTLHGGILATALDTTMGVLVRFCKGGERTSTVSLNTNFLRPLPVGAAFIVEAAVEKTGRRIQFVSAYVTADEEVCATATATFI